MSEVLQQLVDLLSLEKIEEGLFRGESQDLGLPQVYGGQVIGQALSAAKQTVAPSRAVHSLHSYFLRPGNATRPIIYDVEIIRDGGSYSTRRVKAIQHGKPIFYMTASFHSHEESFEHQSEMDKVPAPEELISEREFVLAFKNQLPAKVLGFLAADMPIEIRPISNLSPIEPEPCPPSRHAWFRTKGELPDDAGVHKYLLAYASDFHFLPTALQPHGVSMFHPGIQIATIDHSMWFHRDFRFDDWLLYQVESPSASGGRALVRGHFFDQKGKLVASSAQEGVLRKHRKQRSPSLP